MKTVEKILEEIIEQAKQGSCKTCRWCVGLPKGDFTPYWCEIQGNVNPIHFGPADLDRTAYPWKTELGDWHTAETWEEVEGCLAYQPGRDGTMVDAPKLGEAASKHRDFMVDLNEATHLYYAMRDNTLAELTAKLNEATESLPGAILLDDLTVNHITSSEL